MGRTDTEEYARWEEGFETGQKSALDLIIKIRELLETFELDIIERKLDELTEDR